jgi:enoyl reductase
VVTAKDRIGTVAYQPAADALGVRRLSTERSAAQLRELTALYENGKLRVTVSHCFPFTEAADAHRRIETGHVRGKIVLVP